MSEPVAKLIAKAEHAIQVAEQLMIDGFPSDAASKIYYAMFYSAQALLKSEGIEVIKHSAVASSFGFHFVKTKKIVEKYHKILLSSRKIREIADYDIEREIVEPVASIKIEEGKDFVNMIKGILKI